MAISAIDGSLLSAISRQYLVSSLFSTSSTSSTTSTATTSAASTMATLFTNQQQLITLSALGRYAGKVDAQATATGNSEVTQGLQDAMQAIYRGNSSGSTGIAQALYGQASTNKTLYNTLNTMNQLATEAPDTFNAVLINVKTLADNGMTGAIQSFLTAINNANAQHGLSEVATLNTAVTDALNDTGTSAGTTLQSLTELFQRYTTAETSSNTAITQSLLYAFLANNASYPTQATSYTTYFPPASISVSAVNTLNRLA